MGTRKSVWPFIVGLWLVLVCVGAPGMAYYRHVGVVCLGDSFFYNVIISLLGSIAVFITLALTTVLLCAICRRQLFGKQPRQNSRARNRENMVTTALTVNCVLYTVGGTVHYGLILLLFNEILWSPLIFHISQLALSLAVLRAPIYLCIATMREAFL